jgi:hypothetical protein
MERAVTGGVEQRGIRQIQPLDEAEHRLGVGEVTVTRDDDLLRVGKAHVL